MKQLKALTDREYNLPSGLPSPNPINAICGNSLIFASVPPLN